MSASTGYLYQHLPWNFVTKFREGVVVQKDGLLQRTFAYRAPDTDSSDAAGVNGLSLRVADFARRLGTGWAFHLEAQRFQIRDYPSADFDGAAPLLIDRERGAGFRSAGRHFDSSYFLTFTWRPPAESVRKLASMFVRPGGTGEGGDIGQNVAFFAGESDAAASLLAGDLLLEPLDNAQTVAFLHSSVSLNRFPVRFPHTQIFLDRVLPDSELVTALTMRLGGSYIPIIGVNDFPDESYPAILDGLNRARLEYRWVTRYICMDKEDGAGVARRKEKAHRGSRKTFLQTFAESTSGEPTLALNHGAGVKEGDSIEAGVEIETDRASLGFITTCVMVWDADLEAARRKADLVKAIVNSAGFSCKEETFNALEAWKSMMPGQVYANFRALPVMSYTFSHVVPLSSVWSGFRSNAHAAAVSGVDAPLLTCSTEEGTPFFMNLNIGDVGHSAVWGPTGSGKSTLLNLIEMQFLKYPGSRVLVFDKGRSCRQPCLAVGGRFYEPAGGDSAGVCFQPLRDLETDRDVTDAADFIETCVAVNGYAVTPPLRAAIKESLDQMRGLPPARRTMTSFIQYANYLDPATKRPVLREMLGDYLVDGGKYGKIFDARGSDITLDSRFVAFEMESLMNRGEGCVVPALVHLFNLVERMFDGRLTLLVLDEAWLFLRNEAFADRIAEWLKVLRKRNVYVVFATQDVADVERSPLKTTIVQQCLTKIYLADPGALAPAMTDVYRAFGLSDSEIAIIANGAMKRDYFYTSPAGRRRFRLDLGPLTLALIGAADHALLDGLLSAHGPGVPLGTEILRSKGVEFAHLAEAAMLDRNDAIPSVAKPQPITNVGKEDDPEATEDKRRGIIAPARMEPSIMGDFLDAVAAMQGRKKADGTGRAAEALAVRFGVSQATVYHARRVLRYGDPDLVEELRRGGISVKTALKRLKKEDTGDGE